MPENFLHTLYGRFPRKVVNPILGVFTLLCLLLVFSLSVSPTIDTAGRIMPSREWILARNNEGAVFATLCDHVSSTIDNYSVVSVVRGDAFRFSLHPSIRPETRVRAGDTLVRIYSHEIFRRLSRLSGDLAIARANLAVALSGEKEPITLEAGRALVLAKEECELQTALFRRQDSLFRKNLISPEQYDLARSAARVAALETEIAQARLDNVTTGAKPEQVDVIRSQIAAFEAELRILSAQAGALTVSAPFGGIVVPSAGRDTLCSLEDTSRIAVLPVPVQYQDRLKPGQPVTLRFPRSALPVRGTVVRVDTRVRVVSARQVVLVTANLDDGGPALSSNLVLPGSIETDRVSVGEYLRSLVADILRGIVDSPSRI